MKAKRERKVIGFKTETDYGRGGGGFEFLVIVAREFAVEDAAQNYRDALIHQRSTADFQRQCFEKIEKFKAEIRSPMTKPGLYLSGPFSAVTFRWQGDNESDHWYGPEIRFPMERRTIDLASRIMRQVYKTPDGIRYLGDPTPEAIIKAMLDLKGTPVRFVPDLASQDALPVKPEEFELPKPPALRKAAVA